MSHILGVYSNGSIHKCVARAKDDPKILMLSPTTFAFKPELAYCLATGMEPNIYTIIPYVSAKDECVNERDRINTYLNGKGSTEFNNSAVDYTV